MPPDSMMLPMKRLALLWRRPPRACGKQADIVVKVRGGDRRREKEPAGWTDRPSACSGGTEPGPFWTVSRPPTPTPSPWIWCHGSAAPRKWTCCPRWPILPAIAPSLRPATSSAASSPVRSPPPARYRQAKVLVIGAGVAGLAAIGTATSLGAIVRAFDVRPEVAEQIESMGADFLMLEFEEDGSGEGGYAKPASPEFIEKEMELFRAQAPEIDIVITTALIPGRPAPKAVACRNGRADETGIGCCRSCGRTGRQLRPDRGRPGRHLGKWRHELSAIPISQAAWQPRAQPSMPPTSAICWTI